MPSSPRKTSPTSTAGFTPLGIIATFVALSETVAGLAAIKTGNTVQMIFAVFAVLFPILVAGLFFAILWKRAYVLYPPKEFGPEVDVRHYVEAMRHQAMGNQEIISLVRTSIAGALESKEAQTLISQVTSTHDAAAPVALERASAMLVEQAVDQLQKAVITVDLGAFSFNEATPTLVFPYDPSQKAFALLSAIWYSISDDVPPYTYGKTWALRDGHSGQLLRPENMNWEDNYALADSGNTVEDFGVHAGMLLQAVPLPRRHTRTEPEV